MASFAMESLVNEEVNIMKRIMNDVAVQTLLYTVNPDTEIIIMDIDHYLVSWLKEPFDKMDGSDPRFQIFTVDEILHDYRNVKICKAKIYRTAMNGNKLLLVVDTKNERY